MVFRHRENCVNNVVSERAKVTCALLEIYITHSVYYSIKHRFEQGEHKAFSSLLLICCNAVKIGVVFKKFNLMDPIVYKKPFDLISCRNVMIYFDSDTKNALIERFYDATKSSGYLFIGHAENISRDTRYKYIKPAIYRK